MAHILGESLDSQIPDEVKDALRELSEGQLALLPIETVEDILEDLTSSDDTKEAEAFAAQPPVFTEHRSAQAPTPTPESGLFLQTQPSLATATPTPAAYPGPIEALLSPSTDEESGEPPAKVAKLPIKPAGPKVPNQRERKFGLRLIDPMDEAVAAMDFIALASKAPKQGRGCDSDWSLYRSGRQYHEQKTQLAKTAHGHLDALEAKSPPPPPELAVSIEAYLRRPYSRLFDHLNKDFAVSAEVAQSLHNWGQTGALPPAAGKIIKAAIGGQKKRAWTKLDTKAQRDRPRIREAANRLALIGMEAIAGAGLDDYAELQARRRLDLIYKKQIAFLHVPDA